MHPLGVVPETTIEYFDSMVVLEHFFLLRLTLVSVDWRALFVDRKNLVSSGPGLLSWRRNRSASTLI